MTTPFGHLDDERLLLQLYGAGEVADGRHLEACPVCAARFAELKARRTRLLSAPPAPLDAERLRAQRAAIWAAIGNGRRRPVWRAVQAGALACTVLVGILLYRPAPQPASPAPAPEAAHLSDEQLYEDLAAMLARETPLAAETLMGLFAARNDNNEVQ
jgi:anti-sigma factor RsiW